MLTKRDMEVVDFIKKFKIADTKMITELFYPSERKAQQRLNEIIKLTDINRSREIINEPYFYYFKRPPSQFRHSIKVTEFYVAIKRNHEIKKYNIEPAYGTVRPDAAFVYIDYDNIQKVGLLEVELSSKGFDYGKYENWINRDEYKKYMTIVPKVFIVSKIKKASADDSFYTFISADLHEMGNNSQSNNNTIKIKNKSNRAYA